MTVGAAFFEHGFNDTASFEVAMRRMPPGRGFMIAAGIERLIEALEEYRFDAAAIEHLESLQLFKPAFLEFLSQTPLHRFDPRASRRHDLFRRRTDR